MRSNAAPRLFARAAALALLVTAAACGQGEAAQAGAEARAPAPSTQVAAPTVDAGGVRMVVYKTPSCGCCREWVKHVQAAGFDVVVVDTASVQPIKEENGVPGHLASCHTAVVEGMVIEGHVPAELIVRLLREKPRDVAGIAVAGMPRGSPGMEVPDGTRDPYDVIAFSKQGQVSVYATR
jgi:hypothetical protein